MDKKALFINKTSDWTKKFLSALKSAGWRVEVSPSGMKGVGLAQTNSFNLIIVGDEISDMNPLVVIKNLAGAPSAFFVPIFSLQEIRDNLKNGKEKFVVL